jgi:hypothetical protein
MARANAGIAIGSSFVYRDIDIVLGNFSFSTKQQKHNHLVHIPEIIY